MQSATAARLIASYERLLPLKRLPRTGWLQRSVSQPESIADHEWGVALLALLTSTAVPGVDREQLLTIAILHDLGEALLGDLPHTARDLLGAATKRDAERAAIQQLIGTLPGAEALLASYEAYVEGSTPEARLVKGLDRIELLVQTLDYERGGNRALGDFWAVAEDPWDDEFPLLREMALALLACRAALRD